jgi:hypothetical protein
VVGGVVAFGSGWYPDLDPGTWAQWIGGFGTILAVLVALFGDRIRGWIFGPGLTIVVSLDPPECVRVAISYMYEYSVDGSVSEQEGSVDSVYVRVKVQNTGRSLARDVQVFAESVTIFVPDEGWRPVGMFPAMNLPWSDLPEDADVKLRMFFPGLGPTMSKHCDLGRIAEPGNRLYIGDEKEDLDHQTNAFAFETLVKPNHQGHIVGPGRYQIRLLLAADNARPVVRTIEMIVRPDWRPRDLAAMLSVRVV